MERFVVRRYTQGDKNVYIVSKHYKLICDRNGLIRGTGNRPVSSATKKGYLTPKFCKHLPCQGVT